MPGLEAQNVVVAGSGAVWVAPEGTPMPADLTALVTPWVDVGYVSEDGVTFTVSREQEEIRAWQSLDPVRVLVTGEPKTIAFELLEFDEDTLILMLRGGTVTGTTTKVYTPPDPGVQDVRAMVIDGVDGAYTFRFCFPRVSLSGDVEWTLARSDAIRAPLEFSVLSSAAKWTILTNHPGLSVPTVMLDEMTVAELQAEAAARGLPTSGTKAELIERLTTEAAEPATAAA